MSESSTRTSSNNILARPVILAAAVLFVYWSVLGRLGRLWWEDENYSHGLLIPFIIGYIFWSERDTFGRETKRPSHLWGGAAVACGLVALWAGTAGAEQFMQRTSLVLLLGGVAVYFWGFGMLRRVLVPLLLLALAIPIPTIIFNKVAFPLQLFASQCAVWAMRLFNIPVLREGNVIELLPLNSTVTRKLEVVEACSGIRSLMTLVTLAVVFAYFTSPGHGGDDKSTGEGEEIERAATTKRRRGISGFNFWRGALLVLAAVPIAIITNALRVSGTGVLSRYYGTEIADGFFHSFSGWVMYIVAFLLLFALGWLIDRFNPLRGGRGGKGGGAASAKVSPASESMKDETRVIVNDAHGVGGGGGSASPAMSATSGESRIG